MEIFLIKNVIKRNNKKLLKLLKNKNKLNLDISFRANIQDDLSILKQQQDRQSEQEKNPILGFIKMFIKFF